MIMQIALVLLIILLIMQATFNIYTTLYIWSNPRRLKNSKAPEYYLPPTRGFTVLLPARHEAAVIGETLRRLAQANYPKELYELMVICTVDDTETIDAAKASIREHGITNARVVSFKGTPGKSRGMNLGLSIARHDTITIFDSEDDVSRDIFNIANTLMTQRRLDVLQCGVQLMDYDSRWFSVHNVLEYFFMFKSRIHYFAKNGIVPLGGNTVFFKTDDLKQVGGWDIDGLCEDADIGIRLSIAGKKFGAMYDADHVTREETPHTVAAFVKQRTRWNQGFLQILSKNDWRGLNTNHKVLLVLYSLLSPTFMAFVIVLTPIMLFIGFNVKMNVFISLLTYIPLALSIFVLGMNLIALHEFGRDQHLKIKFRSYVMLVVTFIPYQALLAYSASRAFIREITGQKNWEKTVHLGTHRTSPSVSQSQKEPLAA